MQLMSIEDLAAYHIIPATRSEAKSLERKFIPYGSGIRSEAESRKRKARHVARRKAAKRIQKPYGLVRPAQPLGAQTLLKKPDISVYSCPFVVPY